MTDWGSVKHPHITSLLLLLGDYPHDDEILYICTVLRAIPTYNPHKHSHQHSSSHPSYQAHPQAAYPSPYSLPPARPCHQLSRPRGLPASRHLSSYPRHHCGPGLFSGQSGPGPAASGLWFRGIRLRFCGPRGGLFLLRFGRRGCVSGGFSVSRMIELSDDEAGIECTVGGFASSNVAVYAVQTFATPQIRKKRK